MSAKRRWADLTPGGQLRRLRRLAEGAWPRFGLGAGTLRSLGHWENATFRVQAPARGPSAPRFVPGSYLLRVHSPGYNTTAQVASELQWLRALCRDTDLPVPEPVGEPLVAEHPDVPQPRTCSVLRWMDGQRVGNRASPRTYRALGALLGRLHEHGTTWRPPAGFERARWDADGLFRWWPPEHTDAVMAQLTAKQRRLFARVERRFVEATEALGEGPDAFGLIHGDAHQSNVVIAGGQLRPIDFDDCRFGWLLYDLAVPLRHADRTARPEACRAALLEGYQATRPMTDAQLAWLPLFELTRATTIALFCVSRGLTHAALREAAERVVPEVCERIEAFE